MKLVLSLLVVLSAVSNITPKGLREEFTWTRINYDWPSNNNRPSRQTVRNNVDGFAFPGNTNTRKPTYGSGNVVPGAPTNPGGNANHGPGNVVPNAPGGNYIYENNIPMGANRWRNKLFVTVPRRRVGVPSTLNYIWANSSQRHNVPLIPYPSWQANSLSGNNGQNFVSVYRVAVDSCDRLWFVDTGLIETPGNPDQVQPTTLIVMDLTTDQVVRRHTFNTTLLRPATNLASVTVDVVQKHCGDAYAYIPDLGGYGLIVYSYRDDRSWRVTHNFFYLEPMAGEFRIAGLDFQWNDGIFSIALSEADRLGDKEAYFHSMAGTHIYKVSTRVLKNETLATRGYHGDDFKIVGDRAGASQTSSSGLHAETGVLFLGMVNQNALGCWNIKTPLKDISIVQKNDRTMIYPCDVKISKNDVILLTNTMPVFLYSTLNYDETNFRVWIENVGKAVEGTKCGRR